MVLENNCNGCLFQDLCGCECRCDSYCHANEDEMYIEFEAVRRREFADDYTQYLLESEA